MAISVNVPKDWSGIKRKVIFNLTQRQLVSFALGGIVGIPFYLFIKDILGPDISALGMVAVIKSGYFGKKFFDVSISPVLLILVSPILLITMAAIKIEDGGPVFFKQKRCTKDGKVFEDLVANV